MLTLADIIEALSGARPEWARLVITEAVIDSRQVIPGSLFIALPGERTAGHDYVAQAFERGASIALVQKELPGRFAVLDLRKDQAIPERAAKEAQLCIRVDNTLTALQRVASFWRRRLAVSSQELSNDVHRQFVAVVERERGLTHEEALALSDGRVFTGEQAVEEGLVDTLGTYEDAIMLAAECAGIKGEPSLIRERKRVSWWGWMLGDAGDTLRDLKQEILDRPVLSYRYSGPQD